MIAFQRNNLVFRIASADAISKFKAQQSNSFLQVARKELDFDESTRETVLLEFDKISSWIFKMESLCVSLPFKSMSNSVKQTLFTSFIEQLNFIENIMQAHGDVFSAECISYTKEIHEYTKLTFKNIFIQSLDGDVGRAFSGMVTKVSEYLQHFLVSMHEFNNNIIKKKESSFLCVTDFCINIAEAELKILPCDIRSKFFIQHGCESEFILKNYTAVDMFDDISSSFSKKGIRITKEKNIEHASVA
jgi:hypothetical protein